MHGESRERPQHAIVREDQTDTVESLSKGQRMQSWAEQMVNGSKVVQGGGRSRGRSEGEDGGEGSTDFRFRSALGWVPSVGMGSRDGEAQ